jgi:hypothetical protein
MVRLPWFWMLSINERSEVFKVARGVLLCARRHCQIIYSVKISNRILKERIVISFQGKNVEPAGQASLN